MATLNDLSIARADALEAVPNKLFGAIEKAQLEAWKEIQRLLNQLETTNGVLTISTKNLALVEQIAGLTRQVLFEGDYVNAVRDFANSFDAQSQLTQEYLLQAFGDFSDKELYTQILNQSKRNTVALLNETAVNQALIEPLKQSLTNSITTRSSLTDAIANLQQIVIGDLERESNLLGDRKTLVRDAYSISDAQYANLVQEQYDFSFYKWAGGTVEDTRCFCQKRSNRIWHRKEIEAWGDKKDLGECKSGDGWQGMRKGTNSSTIFSYRGGYSCQHIIVAVPDEAVPPSAYKRADKKGFL